MNIPYSDKEEFIKGHLKSVHFVARKLMKKAQANHVEYEDLCGAGFIGLVMAYNKFDPDRNLRFLTYAIPVIYGQMHRYIRDCGKVIGIPRSERMLADKIRFAQLESRPAAEIASYFGCTVKLASRTLESMHSKLCHLDAVIPQSEDCTSYVELVPSYDDSSVVFVNAFIQTLSDRDRIVVRCRMRGDSQHETGQACGVSQPQIGRDLTRIKTKIQQFVLGG